MKKNIVVFDGNSKFTYGGGQKITAKVIQSLYKDFQFYLFPIEQNPLFFNDIIKNVKIVNSFFIPKSRDFFSLIKLFFIFIRWCKSKNIYYQNTIIYLPSKKMLFFYRFLNYGDLKWLFIFIAWIKE